MLLVAGAHEEVERAKTSGGEEGKEGKGEDGDGGGPAGARGKEAGEDGGHHEGEEPDGGESDGLMAQAEAAVFADEGDGPAEIGEAFLTSNALTVSAGDFHAVGNEPGTVLLDHRIEVVPHSFMVAPGR